MFGQTWGGKPPALDGGLLCNKGPTQPRCFGDSKSTLPVVAGCWLGVSLSSQKGFSPSICLSPPRRKKKKTTSSSDSFPLKPARDVFKQMEESLWTQSPTKNPAFTPWAFHLRCHPFSHGTVRSARGLDQLPSKGAGPRTSNGSMLVGGRGYPPLHGPPKKITPPNPPTPQVPNPLPKTQVHHQNPPYLEGEGGGGSHNSICSVFPTKGKMELSIESSRVEIPPPPNKQF